MKRATLVAAAPVAIKTIEKPSTNKAVRLVTRLDEAVPSDISCNE